MNWYNQNSWTYEDPYPNLPLDKIFPISVRAKSLYARYKANSTIEDGFLQISGAINMMDGLDYHFDNFQKYHVQIYKGKDMRKKLLSHYYNEKGINKCIQHEIVAYFNRVGQFYYFVDSDFVKERLPNVLEQIPLIKRLIRFRHKYTAHRSIDKPLRGDEGRAMYHEITFGLSNMYNAEGNMIFQICTAQGVVRFNPEKEHQVVIEEAYTIIERLTGL